MTTNQSSEIEERIIKNIKYALEDLYKELKKQNNIPEVLIKYLEEFKNCKYEMVMLGNTKAGKSTLLNEIMENKLELNTGPSKETSLMWRLSFSETFENYEMQQVY